MPRSVEQLTELVGRMPLKDIVRESTDLIERQCIEAALAFTSNNRASAAEILGSEPPEPLFQAAPAWTGQLGRQRRAVASI
jgi:transcriptional regulator with GAF, ATPase, and Fis domain